MIPDRNISASTTRWCVCFKTFTDFDIFGDDFCLGCTHDTTFICNNETFKKQKKTNKKTTNRNNSCKPQQNKLYHINNFLHQKHERTQLRPNTKTNILSFQTNHPRKGRVETTRNFGETLHGKTAAPAGVFVPMMGRPLKLPGDWTPLAVVWFFFSGEILLMEEILHQLICS